MTTLHIYSTSFYGEVVNVNSWFSNEVMVETFYTNLYIFSIGSEKYVLLEPCFEGKNAFIRRPQGVEGEYVFMYLCVLYIMGVGIPFTIFEISFLKLANVAPS